MVPCKSHKYFKPLILSFIFLVTLLGFTGEGRAATFCVDDNSDGAANAGDCDSDCTDGNANCSMRDAITASENAGGSNRIIFNIGAGGQQTITIDNAQGPLPTITVPLDIDGTTQANFAGAPLIELDGNALSSAGDYGLEITAGSSAVRSLIINQFPDNGIQLENGGSNTVQGCYIGLNPAGDTDLGNSGHGVEMNDSNNNLIEGNVISGNGASGVEITEGAQDNMVQGNLIGTDAGGTVDLGNNNDGVHLATLSGENNLIGGDQPGEGNLLSGNQRGITKNGNPFQVIQGNLIGTDINGTSSVPNSFGGILLASSNCLVGGTTPGAGNLISGNNDNGIIFSNVVGNFTIQGNRIGTDISGTQALPNQGHGISLTNVNNTLVGGTDPGAGNLISGNTENGILIGGSSIGMPIIQGNFIGTDATGANAVPNGENGIEIVNNTFSDVVGIPIGGDQVEEGNVIAFNTLAGIHLADTSDLDIREISILSNSIFSNGDLGILIDPGFNDGIQSPSLNTAQSSGLTATVTGTFNGTPNTEYLIQLFSNNALDPSGFGEGQFFVGQGTVTTNGFGSVNFDLTVDTDQLNQNGLLTFDDDKLGVLQGSQMTATATNPGGSTSQFSNGVPIVEVGRVMFSMFNVTVNETAGSATLQVLRTGGAADAITVDVVSSDGTAVAGVNYGAVNQTLTFGAGETQQEVTVDIIDQNTNGSLTAFFSLTNPTGGAAVASPDMVLLTIVGSGGGGEDNGGCTLAPSTEPRGGQFYLLLAVGLLVLSGVRVSRRSLR